VNTYNNHQLVDVIEQANDRQPFCGCGRPTEPVYRDGYVWLECSSLRDAPRTRLARVVAAITLPTHVHEKIIDVAPPEEGLPTAA
jgi:hypothetical protein